MNRSADRTRGGEREIRKEKGRESEKEIEILCLVILFLIYFKCKI